MQIAVLWNKEGGGAFCFMQFNLKCRTVKSNKETEDFAVGIRCAECAHLAEIAPPPPSPSQG